MNTRIQGVASFAVALISLGIESTFAQTTERVSVDSAGAQGNSSSISPAVSSAAGRFVAFGSLASNLVAGDSNAAYDVFVRDRVTETMELVSVATGGAQGNHGSAEPAISADGRFVAFSSAASNFVVGDTNAAGDIFVRDRALGTTECVSIDSTGALANAASFSPSLSADGRFVAFWSNASNLVAGDTNGNADVFVRDRAFGTTERVSVDSAGAQHALGGWYPSISANGRFVAFESGSSQLVVGDTNGCADIFVRDRLAGTTERVSVDSSGTEGDALSANCSISADGRYVAFASFASNLVAGDTNGAADVFVRDRTLGTTARASVAAGGAQGNGGSAYPSISADGRCVAFQSGATNLVAGGTNGVGAIFLRDRTSGTTECVSVDSNGAQPLSPCDFCSISPDGRCVAFQSTDSSLVVGDTNGFLDLFVRERWPQSPVAYCTSSTSSHGCIASIAASANPSLSLASACSITVTSVEGQTSGILFYGIDNTAFVPGAWAAGSASFLCVKSPTQRTPIQSSGGAINACNGSFVLDWNAYQTANPLALGNPWSVGAKVYAQAWFRDPLAVKATNLSNALELTFEP